MTVYKSNFYLGRLFNLISNRYGMTAIVPHNYYECTFHTPYKGGHISTKFDSGVVQIDYTKRARTLSFEFEENAIESGLDKFDVMLNDVVDGIGSEYLEILMKRHKDIKYFLPHSYMEVSEIDKDTADEVCYIYETAERIGII